VLEQGRDRHALVHAFLSPATGEDDASLAQLRNPVCRHAWMVPICNHQIEVRPAQQGRRLVTVPNGVHFVVVPSQEPRHAVSKRRMVIKEKKAVFHASGLSTTCLRFVR
jgi:hypothetical protein